MVDNSFESKLVNSTWRIERLIGTGTFSEVYLGVNIRTGEEVAIKIETNQNKVPQLFFESRVIKILQHGIGFCKIKWFGTIDKIYNSLVLELLGPSLEDLFNFCGRKFTMKTVLMLADQILIRLEFLHNKSFIHRDVKPENLLMGVGRNCNKVYLIDFGVSKRYRDYKSKNHIPYRDDRALTGTARYSSINSHAGIELSRRDDLESLGYVLMYFLRSNLPWQNMKAKSKQQKWERIYEKKMSTPIESICKGYPVEFSRYLLYTRNLKYEETPDYQMIRDEFLGLFRTLNFVLDYVYDWSLLKDKANPSNLRHGHVFKIAENVRLTKHHSYNV